MAELLPTGTVTLLLADVEGSTRLWETQPDAMTAAIARLDQRPSRSSSPSTAAYAPSSRVRATASSPRSRAPATRWRARWSCSGADLAPIRLRIGVHTGDVQLRDEGNYAGPTINKTARLRDLAHGGQTVMSAATEEMVEDQLPDDAWLTDLGRSRAARPPPAVRVSQLCHPDLAQRLPAAADDGYRCRRQSADSTDELRRPRRHRSRRSRARWPTTGW